MSCRLVRRFTAAACVSVLALCAHSTLAHRGEPAEGPETMDCDHPPGQALGVSPDPVAQWTRIDCRSSGQLLVQNENRVNFVYRSEDDIWGVPCAPECRPEHLFHVFRSR